MPSKVYPHQLRPIIIRESRYRGTYSGGQYIITGGVSDPSKTDMEATGGNVECDKFWRQVRSNGPVITVHHDEFGDIPVFVASGKTVTDVKDKYDDFIEQLTEKRDTESIINAFVSHPDLLTDAIEGDVVAQHKVAALSAAYVDSNQPRPTNRVIKRVYARHFPDCPNFSDLSETQKTEIRQEFTEKTGREVPMRFKDHSKFFETN